MDISHFHNFNTHIKTNANINTLMPIIRCQTIAIVMITAMEATLLYLKDLTIILHFTIINNKCLIHMKILWAIIKVRHSNRIKAILNKIISKDKVKDVTVIKIHQVLWVVVIAKAKINTISITMDILKKEMTNIINENHNKLE